MPRAASPRPPAPARTLRQRAIALLARREYARAELAARLVASGAPREAVEAVLDELVELGLLSDSRFAAALVHRKATRYGRRAIAHALREKGVAAKEANAALAAIEGGDELLIAQTLLGRRFGGPPGDERERARQLRFLLSRGYSHAIAFKALRAAGAAVDDASD